MSSVLTHGFTRTENSLSYKRIRKRVAKGGETDHRVQGACGSFPNHLKNKH